jgi:hypothetical protein
MSRSYSEKKTKDLTADENQRRKVGGDNNVLSPR